MTYEEKFRSTAVLGAAGKMGSGITFLLCNHLAKLSLTSGTNFKVYALDISTEALDGLLSYIKKQSYRKAEKEYNKIKEFFPDSNLEKVCNQYVDKVLSILQPVTSIDEIRDAKCIFEAVNEKPELKVKLFNQIERFNNDPFYFTNTSSVPINLLDNKSNLNGRIIGFHFYNPPAVQKLVEIISSDYTSEKLKSLAYDLAKNLRKTVVSSNDIAGFIGNGHFIREILYAEKTVNLLLNKFSLQEAIYYLNDVTQRLLIRPMGIFQLIDYVGIDVCNFIMNVMNDNLNENIGSKMLINLESQGFLGGQNADGSQKNGIFKYERGSIVGVVNKSDGDYSMIEESKMLSDLGEAPKSLSLWKDVIKLENKDEYLTNYFEELSNCGSVGSKLAIDFSINSKVISQELVKSGVALNNDDVNTVLQTGFFHAYGAVNNYLKV